MDDLEWERDRTEEARLCHDLVMAQIHDLGGHMARLERERDEALAQAALGMAPQYCLKLDCFVYRWIPYGQYNTMERPDNVWQCNVHSE